MLNIKRFVLVWTGAAPSGLVRGTVLLNCSGGMNNKAITDDWRLQLASPLLWLIDFLLQRPSIATWLFNRVKSRSAFEQAFVQRLPLMKEIWLSILLL